MPALNAGDHFINKLLIMGTLITAAIVLGSLALIVGLLMYIHNRDKRADEATRADTDL